MFKVAVLGAGKIGYNHIEGFMGHPESEVIALVDKNEARLQKAADQYDITYRFQDFKEVMAMDDIDIISIGLPNFLHYETAMNAMENGKHVMCEKPMGMNYKQAHEMMKKAKETDRFFMVGQNFRFREDAQLIKKYIEDSELGDPYHGRAFLFRKNGIPKMGTWFTLKKYSGGGCLIDIGVHIIDMILYLMGSFDAEAVSGQVYDKFGHRDIGRGTWGMSDPEDSDVLFDVDDYASVMIKLKGGKTVIAEISWHAYVEPSMKAEVLCSEGGASINPFRIQKRTEGRCEILEKVEMEKGFDVNLHRIGHFVDCLADDSLDPVVPIEESVKLQKILDAVYESSRTGKEIRL